MDPSILLKVIVFVSCILSTALSEGGTKQKVILLLSDGLRWDRFRLDVPNLDEIEKKGVRADWLDGVFITMTMPSTYSIATGLYPESHGVVNNVYFNKTTKERTYRFVETLNVTEWFDTGVEPIWVTAKNAGKRVGSILYVGSWLPIKGVELERVIPLSPYFWDNYKLEDRVRDAVNWISDDFDLVLLYFNDPDFVLHSYLIEDEHSIAAVKNVDKQIGYLFQLIEERGLSDEVNVIIVSDHGFVDVDPRKFIRLYDYINESDVDFIIDYGAALFQLAPVEGKLEEVYEALKTAHPALHVYKKEEFPERLHYANHPRNLPIIGFVDPEWHLHKTWDPSTDQLSGGDHGYDNRWMSMKSSFYAQGPFFKQGYRARPLESDGTKQKVILLLSDGLRWDRFRLDVPNLDEIEKNGVRADWLDGVFITMTMPSTYSIATGLYPESHGVVSNVYFNQTTKERTFSFVDTLNVTEWFDTGVEPIWVTAKNAGKRVGSILYVGSWLPINGVKLERVIPLSPYFWDNYDLEDRVRDAVDWISDDFDLVLLYFNYPDFVLHSYLIEDEHSIASVKDVDTQIGYLFQLIKERGLSDEVNVIIVSDHGFVDVDPRKFIRLYDYINESDVDFIIDYGPALFQLAPLEGKLEEVYQALKTAHPALHVYKKEEFPERLHYASHPRNLPIIGFVDPEWHLHKTWDPSIDQVKGGNHGYDNRWMSMKSSFYAQGPFFKQGYRARPLESVDIYEMMCEILDITPAPNNGSRHRYVDMIRSGGTFLTPRVTVSSFVIMMCVYSLSKWVTNRSL